jgi:hypothetical protein
VPLPFQFCLAEDKRLRAAAGEDLEYCESFAEMVTHLPLLLLLLKHTPEATY